METFLKVLFLGAASITSGCAPTEVEKAQQNFLCKDQGGVSSYTGDNFTKVHCNNGESYSYEVTRDVTITDPEFYAKSK